MGYGSTDSKQVSSYYERNSHITHAKNIGEIFSSEALNEKLDPRFLKNGFRESCDSADNPNSRAIAIGFDETGSMGTIPFSFIKDGFPKFIKMIQGGVLGYDPHILFTAIGDVKCDDAPLQVTQFEADTRMLDQLSMFYIERGGGGNNGESYQLPWYFLAKHTKIDCFNKRGQKGIYISIGDDKPHQNTTMHEIKSVFGSNEGFEYHSISTENLRDMALEKWHLFHIMLSEDGYGSSNVEGTWKNLLGNHAVVLEDHNYIAETVATILKVQNGMDKAEAINMIENKTAKKFVRMALSNFEIYEEEPNNPSNESKIEYI